MISEMLAKCGCACSRCPTFKMNLRNKVDRNKCSSGWKAYLGISLSPEKLRRCDGCLADDRTKPTRYLNCIVRRCALRNGIDNCAYCSEFPCNELKTVHEGQSRDYRNIIETRIGAAIPEDDYRAFIEPYEGLNHLISLRGTLRGEDINTIKPLTLKSKSVPFPDTLNVSGGKLKSYRTLHRILSAIDKTLENISYARRESEKKTRPYILKLLWTCGLYGTVDPGDNTCLVLDSVNYFKMKNQYRYPVLKSYFDHLKNVDIHGTLVPLAGKKWMNDMGILKMKAGKSGEPAWEIRLSFGDSAGGVKTADALRTFTAMLDREYGEDGIMHFYNADMSILRNG